MLSNYTNISAAVSDWLNRATSADVTDSVEDFIILAQRNIQRDVRIPPMEVGPTTLTIVSGQATIPTSMLDVKEMVGDNGVTAWDIKRGSYAEALHLRNSDQQGPQVFDTTGSNFEFGPEPSSGVTVRVVYYQELEFISETVDTNWFSQFAPETILYGALEEAAIFIKDEGMAKVYNQKFQAALAAIKTQKLKAEFSGRLEVRNR